MFHYLGQNILKGFPSSPDRIERKQLYIFLLISRLDLALR